MKYKKNNRSSTPLGDLFDKADFPLDPTAWSQMETLLSEVPTQPKTGRGSIKRIIGVLLLGILFIGGGVFMMKDNKNLMVNQSPFNAQNAKIVETNSVGNLKEATLSKEQAGYIFEAKKVVFEANNEGNNASNTFTNSPFKTLQYKPKSNYANASNLVQNTNYSTFKNTDYSTFKNAFSLNQNKAFDEKKGNNALENTQNETQNGVQNNLNASAEKAKIDSVLKATPPQYFEEKQTPKPEIGLTIEDIYEPEKRIQYSIVEPLQFQETTADINSEFSFDFAPYGWAMDQMRAIKRPLWNGKKHQLYVGMGVISNISSFNLKYVRRITPLMGLGAFYYQAKDEFSSYENISHLGLEAQFYLVNRRHFEVNLTMSYAHEWGSTTTVWGSPNIPIHPENKSNFSFGAGLELRYCFNQNWNVGFRLDTKKQLANLLLQLGYRF
jgi:hypothetical protein